MVGDHMRISVAVCHDFFFFRPFEVSLQWLNEGSPFIFVPLNINCYIRFIQESRFY